MSTDNTRYVIKLTDFKPPKYVFDNDTFMQHIGYARKFNDKSFAEKYAKTHDNIAGQGYEIVEYR